MALDLPYKPQTFSITKSSLLAREYQHVNIQSLTHQIILKPLLTNSNRLLQHIRKSIRRKYKLFLRTNNSIKETTTITAIIIATAATLYTTATDRDYVTLYIIRKDIAYKNILRRNKKSPKLSSELLIEIDLVNLTTDLKNDLTNILQIIRMTIPT